jgi:flagellar basal-body rod modification protein FlgD
MDGKDLAAQLAQFTSVEQLQNLNTAMATQTQASQMAALVGQSSLSASLIGRQVEAAGNQVVVPSSGSPKVTVDIGGSGGAATLTLKDDSGNVIATRTLGQVAGGTAKTLTLPSDLPPGRWHYSVDVVDANKAAVSVTTYVSGVVSAVEFKNGAISLSVDGMDVALTDIVRIAPAAAATGGTGTTPGSTRPILLPEPGPIGNGNPTGGDLVHTVLDLLGARPSTTTN